MPEHVRGDVFFNADAFGIFFNHEPDGLFGQSTIESVKKKVFSGFQLGVEGQGVAVQGVFCIFVTDGQHPFLISFARDANRGGLEIDGGAFEVGRVPILLSRW